MRSNQVYFQVNRISILKSEVFQKDKGYISDNILMRSLKD